MNLYYEDDKIEVGLDEAGRGCLFGPVFTAGVIWNGEKNDDIIDSKLISKKK
jgi:ribonuclease HII